MFQATASQRKLASSVCLLAANGSSIKTIGHRDIFLALPGLSVVHKFLLADVKKPVLGSDFFRRNNLLIDVARQQLIRPPSAPSPLVVRARPAIFSGGLCGLRCGTSVDDVFASFPSVTSSSPVYDSSVPPKHGVSHTVPTSGPPMFARARRLFGEKLDVAKAEFKKMSDMGIIRPSNSPWASPLHVCLLYTSPSPRDLSTSRMPSSA